MITNRTVMFTNHRHVDSGEVTCTVCVSDLDIYGRMQTIVIYPLTTADIYSDAIRQQTERASSVELTLEDTIPGKPPKG